VEEDDDIIRLDLTSFRCWLVLIIFTPDRADAIVLVVEAIEIGVDDVWNANAAADGADADSSVASSSIARMARWMHFSMLIMMEMVM